MLRFAFAVTIAIALVFSAQGQATNPTGTNGTITNSAPIKKIPTAEAAKHLNETMIVTGKIAHVTVRPAVVILNLDKAYPDAPFSAVVFSKVTNQFGNLTNLLGKDVEIQGLIKDYKGTPEIIMDKTNQLTIVSNAPAPAKMEAK
jgi:DNA/RNA endonuclease YhcR with UshA esterase domain